MPRFKVVRVLRQEIEVDAKDVAGALENRPYPLDSMTVIRERAKDLDKHATPVSAISDRKMRAGRVFTRTYHDVLYTATVIPGGRVKLDGADFVGVVYKNLNKATQALLKGTSANAWVFWGEGPQGEKTEEEPKADTEVAE